MNTLLIVEKAQSAVIEREPLQAVEAGRLECRELCDRDYDH